MQAAPDDHFTTLVDQTRRAIVLIVEPYRRLAYTWNASGEDAANGTKSIVTWLFSPAKVGIVLNLKHTGFRTHEEVEEHAASFGWQRYMSELSRVAGGLD